jgi:hypothetical protein
MGDLFMVKTFLYKLLLICSVFAILIATDNVFFICILGLCILFVYKEKFKSDNNDSRDYNVFNFILQSLFVFGGILINFEYILYHRIILATFIGFLILFENTIKKIPFIRKTLADNWIFVSFIVGLFLANVLY